MRSHPARRSPWLLPGGGGDAPTTGGIAVTDEITPDSHHSIEHGVSSEHAPISKHPMRTFGEKHVADGSRTDTCVRARTRIRRPQYPRGCLCPEAEVSNAATAVGETTRAS